MKIIKNGIIYSGENMPSLSSCAFPGMCRLKNGTLLATFKGAETKGPYNKTDKGMTCISNDGGKTWSAPFEAFVPPVVDGNQTTIRTLYYTEVSESNLLAVCNAVDSSLEDLPYYNEETEGLKYTYIMVSHSADGGKTWSPLSRVDVETFKGMPLPLTGAPFVTRDGRVGIQFEVNKPYYEKEYWVHHSAVVFSEDGGYTWGNEVVITDNPDVYYWDQRVDTLDDGRIVDVFWTFDRNKGDYVNIHYCESTDGGRSFGKLTDIGLVGQPGNVIDGKDGSMLLIYINRDTVPVIRIAESLDRGKTWKDALTVFDYGENTKGKQNAGMNDVWAEMAAFSTGHPYIERLDDNTAIAYYYSGPSTHRTDFCYAVIEL
ncbi:MAG: exo-alpha-sialidase [Clostridia bacterium]|nr:exo-alpha-sialidase [Clostridia bacterium]